MSNSLQRHLAVVLVSIVGLVAGLVLGVSVPTARADAPLPPIPTFPEATDTAPPAEAIPDTGCTGWYEQGSYAGQSTGSTWWEFSCRGEWPLFTSGQTNADWAGQYIWTNFFYWDGEASVFYGQWWFDGYSDSMFWATYCDYWWDQPTGQSYGPYALTAPGECVG